MAGWGDRAGSGSATTPTHTFFHAPLPEKNRARALSRSPPRFLSPTHTGKRTFTTNQPTNLPTYQPTMGDAPETFAFQVRAQWGWEVARSGWWSGGGGSTPMRRRKWA